MDNVTVTSEYLKDNPLGDPHVRPLWVLLPPGYHETDERYPAIYVIQGFSGQVEMWGDRAPWRTRYVDMLEELFASGEAPPALVVFVDAWTRLGGGQYVDSHGHGRYHSYLCEEVVAYVDRHYRTIPDAAHRAITGKSSGGYGALITPMLRPDVFGALASHAGDALFEVLYPREFLNAARTLRDVYGGSWDAFLEAFFASGGLCEGKDMILLYANAASYSANPDGTVDIPFDDLGRVVPEVWRRWLEYDPVRMAATHAEALRGLHSIWLDAGRSDEFFLDMGATAMHAALLDAGVTPDRLHFELFEGTHAHLEHRYVMAIKWLSERLKAL